MASKIQKELALLVTGKDVSATRTMRGVSREVNNLSKIAGKASSNITRNLQRVGLVAATAVVGGIGFAIKAAGDFEAQLNTINTVARLTPEELAKVGESLRAIARDTGTSLDDLSKAYYDLVSAGISAADAQKVLAAANTLGIGGLATTAETVDLLTTAINAYGGDASRAGAIADIFAKAIERGKVTAADLAATFAQVGPLAASNGIEIEELAAAYAKFTATGFDASQTSTFMASAIIALTRRTGDLEKLEKATGKSYLAIAGKKGLASAFEELRIDASKTKKPLIDFLGRQEALQFAIGVTGDEYADYARELEAVGKAEGVAGRQADERLQGFNHQLDLLRANVTDAAITLGQQLLPTVTALAREGVDWLKGHQPEIAQFAKDLGVGLREAVTWAQKLDWAAIGGGLETAGRGAKVIGETFMGLPDWVKTAVLTGWGLNKLTGGAVVDFGKLVLGRGSNAAMPMYVWQVNQVPGAGGGPTVIPPGGKPGGPGAASSGGAGWLKVLGWLGIGVLLAEGAVALQEHLDPGRQARADAEGPKNPLLGMARGTRGRLPGGAWTPPGAAFPAIMKPLPLSPDERQAFNDLGQKMFDVGASVVNAIRLAEISGRTAQQQTAFAIRDKDLSVRLTVQTDVRTTISSRDVVHAVVRDRLIAS